MKVLKDQITNLIWTWLKPFINSACRGT